MTTGKKLRDIFSEETLKILKEHCGDVVTSVAELPIIIEVDEERIAEINETVNAKTSS